ncbi:MAG: branched-chain amino acid ABC transporter permease [Peptococcaceae bacterium]|nr:branched-chain amino acid ABC transporter permease [Peptococcaceae bacterium]
MITTVNPSKKLVLFILLLVFLAVLPLIGTPRTIISYIFLFSLYLTMANMWNLLAGYSGLVSLCQPAFLGLAGYVLVIFTWKGLPFYLGIIGGAVVVAIFAVIISVPVFRMSGLYFAIGTLVIPEVLRIIFFLWKPVGGSLHGRGAGYVVKGIEGLSLNHYYWFAVALGIASIILMSVILNSKLGMGLLGVRDNSRAAASSGVNVYRLKLYSFIISATVTGIAGAVFYIYQGYIDPTNAFSLRWTMSIMLAVAIGGMGTEKGPIIGAAVITFLHFLLGKYAGISLLIQGVILVGIMLIAPRGLISLVANLSIYRSLVNGGAKRSAC